MEPSYKFVRVSLTTSLITFLSNSWASKKTVVFNNSSTFMAILVINYYRGALLCKKRASRREGNRISHFWQQPIENEKSVAAPAIFILPLS